MYLCRNTTVCSCFCILIYSQLAIQFNNSGHSFCYCSQIYIAIHSKLLFLLLKYVIALSEEMYILFNQFLLNQSVTHKLKFQLI